MPFGNSEMNVPEGQMKIAQRFNAGTYATAEQVPKGRLIDGATPYNVQPSLRDANCFDVLPGVETPGYSRVVPPGQWFAIPPGNFRKALALGGCRTGTRAYPALDCKGAPLLDTTTNIRGSAKRNAAFTLQQRAILSPRQPEGCV